MKAIIIARVSTEEQKEADVYSEKSYERPIGTRAGPAILTVTHTPSLPTDIDLNCYEHRGN